MQSLSDLNNYSQTQITFGDDRPFETVFDRTTPVDQDIEFFENQSAIIPVGIEIVDIIDAENSAVEYIIDMTGVGVDVELDFGTLPAGVTVTESPNNYWIVDGINGVGTWNSIKSPTATFEFGTVGVASFSTDIEYTLPDSSRGVKTTDITATITAIDYLDSVAEVEYSALEQGFAPDTPLVIADAGVFDPTYTMTITSGNTPAIENMSVTGNDSAVFDATAGSLVFSGDKDEINAVLDTFEIDFTAINEDFVMTYTLTNDLNSNVDIEITDFVSLEFASTISASADILAPLSQVLDGTGDIDAIATTSSTANARFSATTDTQSIAQYTGQPDGIVRDASATLTSAFTVDSNESLPAIYHVVVPTATMDVYLKSNGTEFADSGTYDAYTGITTYTTTGGLVVDWGDGTIETNPDYIVPSPSYPSQPGYCPHTYSSPGTYTVKVYIPGSRTPIGILYTEGGVNEKFSIQTWGDMEATITSPPGQDVNIAGLVGVGASSIPSRLRSDWTNIDYLLANVYSSDISNAQYWDTSNITSMIRTVHNNTAIIPPLASWDTSSVTNMSNMFNGASKMDQDISGWDVSNVTEYNNFDFNTLSSWTADEKPNFT